MEDISSAYGSPRGDQANGTTNTNNDPVPMETNPTTTTSSSSSTTSGKKPASAALASGGGIGSFFQDQHFYAPPSSTSSSTSSSSGFWNGIPTTQPPPQQEEGERVSFQLADGNEVSLNANSKIRVKLPKQRKAMTTTDQSNESSSSSSSATSTASRIGAAAELEDEEDRKMVEMIRAKLKQAGEDEESDSEEEDRPTDEDGIQPSGGEGGRTFSSSFAGANPDAADPKAIHSPIWSQLNATLVERTKFIPIRLSHKERKVLRLLEAALGVSEYTDKIDIITWKNKAKRIHMQLMDLCAILSGLLVACDYKTGQATLVDRSFADNAAFFQEVFEIGRRHKVMNPEKMRTEYGKLVHLLQDAANPTIQSMLGFSCKKEMKTVYGYLEAGGALGVLSDEKVYAAVMEIIDDGTRSRAQIQRQIKEKERAVKYLSTKYKSARMSAEEIELCLYSIGDNHSFIRSNHDPLAKMIAFLTHYFDPRACEEGFSLAIQAGYRGARLTHSHERQYHYVLQSLTLWKEVTLDMFRLWYLAEADLLDENSRYRLSDTGQGLNRIQAAPRIGRAMHSIIFRTKERIGEHWVGSSVVHLGDHNVPNALTFIDKYTQVPRIINPIVLTIEEIDRMVKNDGLRQYIDQSFGGKERLKKEILADFFRFAFDGSGADNFFDAGSCIDGRLTSAWNWCERISKKEFYPIFKLAGFDGFDGNFQK